MATAKKKTSVKKAASVRKSTHGKDALGLLNLKVSKKDRALFLARARQFTKGNVSEWLRLAGTQFNPPKAVRA